MAADLAFAWGERAVLERFSLSVGAGEHVALLGPNGSGKSTALRLFAGLAPLARGQIRWSFAGLGAGSAGLAPTDPAARARIGVVFQQPSLDLALSARENLHLAGLITGLDRATAKRRASELLELVGLAERAAERGKNLSGGMRRRLDLARALVHEPEVLLLDEPTSGLDAEHVQRFWEHLAAIRRTRVLTVIAATHRAEEAELAQRLVMLHEGRVACDGAPADVLKALGNDLLVVRAAGPDEIAGTVMGRLGLVARVVAGEVILEVPPADDATRALVRVVELFAPGRIESIALRRPTLADAFAKVTALSLAEAPSRSADQVRAA
ncbi:MAG: ABC transporter ATP-binding protein [Myxococcota bacterium]